MVYKIIGYVRKTLKSNYQRSFVLSVSLIVWKKWAPAGRSLH
jgi:hypothetical protein